MSGRPIAAVLLGLAGIASLGSCRATGPVGPVVFDRAFREETFDRFFDDLDEHYPYFDQLDCDWQAVVRRARREALRSGSRAEFVHAITRALAALDDPHVGLALPYASYAAAGDPWTIAAPELARIEGRLFVVGWARTEAATPPEPFPAHPCPELVAIDGVPPRLGLLTAQLSGPPGTPVRLLLAWPDGSLREHVVHRLPLGRDPGWRSRFDLRWDHESWISRARKGGLGILNPASFDPDVTGSDTDQMIADVEHAFAALGDVQRLILDLQFNTGGRLAVGGVLGEFLIREPTSLGSFSGHLLGFVPFTERFVLTPREDRFRGPLVVLVNGLTASTSEHLALLLQRSGRAVVIGERTPGAEAAVREVEAADGTVLAYGDRPLERDGAPSFQGRGVVPDIEIPLSIAEVRAQGYVRANVLVENERVRAALSVLGSALDYGEIPHASSLYIKPRIPLVPAPPAAAGAPRAPSPR